MESGVKVAFPASVVDWQWNQELKGYSLHLLHLIMEPGVWICLEPVIPLQLTQFEKDESDITTGEVLSPVIMLVAFLYHFSQSAREVPEWCVKKFNFPSRMAWLDL